MSAPHGIVQMLAISEWQRSLAPPCAVPVPDRRGRRLPGCEPVQQAIRPAPSVDATGRSLKWKNRVRARARRETAREPAPSTGSALSEAAGAAVLPRSAPHASPRPRGTVFARQ